MGCKHARITLADDTAELRAVLDRIARGLDEARAAAAVIEEGDPTALGELDALADALAGEVATLKALTSGGRL